MESYAMMLIMDWRLRSYKGAVGSLMNTVWIRGLNGRMDYGTCIAQGGISFVNSFVTGQSTGF